MDTIRFKKFLSNKAVFWFSWKRMWIFFLALFILLSLMVDAPDEKLLIRSSVFRWTEANVLYSNIINYWNSHGSFPVWEEEKVCRELNSKDKYCIPWEYKAFNDGKGFVFLINLNTVSIKYIYTSDWCKYSDTSYYKTQDWCLTENKLNRILNWYN
ncbi:MAG: hypothetical protein ACD_2C00052G0014 [uncultured bacterium (gcode 4)]|uniref:Uncharacterized protein n=1 Tax=uncultured bacterium (gcode 4) TaxID=1234023 RepID=K2G485_9BACT|nr:MAG: hypothetical protein ACD_2C00052G0014 [uncultured bacterium (gcode 4)]